jgi:hypothetical protein
VRYPDEHRPAVRRRIVEPIGNGHAHGRGTKVVILHHKRTLAPGHARVLELAYQLFFFESALTTGCPARVNRVRSLAMCSICSFRSAAELLAMALRLTRRE